MRFLGGVLGFVLLTVSARAQEARAPVAGTWKLSVLVQGQDIALAIVRVEVKDGKAEAVVVATGAKTFAGAKVVAVRADERALHLTFRTPASSFTVAAYGRKEERRPKTLLGSIEIRNKYEVATLSRTLENELDQTNPATPAEGADAIAKLLTPDDARRDELLAEVLKKYDGRPIAFAAVQRVWQHYAAGKYDHAVTAKHAEQYVKVAAGFGREMETQAALEAARGLLNKKDGAEAAVVFAGWAAKLLTDADPPARHLTVLKTLAAAVRRTDADGPLLRTVNEHIAKIETLLDAEFEQAAVPFKVTPFVRKDKSSRVAVFELFGGDGPDCVAADVVFDAFLRAYKPSDVVLLQYALHHPRPNPLSNPDAEKRAATYGAREAPAGAVNGSKPFPLNGDADDAEALFKTLTGLVNLNLAGPAKAALDLSATRDGDKVEVTATLKSLSGKEPRLRVLLVEDAVRYPGVSGRRLHRHVVRAVVADVEAKLPKGEAVPQKFTLNVAGLRRDLAVYLDKANDGGPFVADARPLELTRLKVVALIQEKQSGEILHAVQVDVPNRSRP